MPLSKPMSFRPRQILLVIGGVFGLSSACLAQSTEPQAPTREQPASPTTGDTIRLTDEERNDILLNNTSERAAHVRGEQADTLASGRGIHGEFGVMIGTGGARGAYGVAEIPLGESAGAVVSFESSRFGGTRR
jgi:hypothetical protein